MRRRETDKGAAVLRDDPGKDARDNHTMEGNK
jgi:hypothetical protein